jgi:hypothetical protein
MRSWPAHLRSIWDYSTAERGIIRVIHTSAAGASGVTCIVTQSTTNSRHRVRLRRPTTASARTATCRVHCALVSRILLFLRISKYFELCTNYSYIQKLHVQTRTNFGYMYIHRTSSRFRIITQTRSQLRQLATHHLAKLRIIVTQIIAQRLDWIFSMSSLKPLESKNVFSRFT